MWCWGNNSFGQVGDGTINLTRLPTRVGSANNWARVSAGDGHTCGVRTTGSLWCWGDACSVVAVGLAAAVSSAAASTGPDITAERAAVYDPESEAFMHLQPGNPPGAAMASTAKIMTIHVALGAVADGHASLSDLVPFSQNAASTGCNCFNDAAGTIQDGDRMYLQDALYAVAVSDGEPTVAVAESSQPPSSRRSSDGPQVS